MKTSKRVYLFITYKNAINYDIVNNENTFLLSDFLRKHSINNDTFFNEVVNSEHLGYEIYNSYHTEFKHLENGMTKFCNYYSLSLGEAVDIIDYYFLKEAAI